MLADFFSKRWIIAHLSIGSSFLVFRDFLGIQFSITHATNRGAAWGVLANYPHALLILRLVTVVSLFALVYLKWTHKRAEIPFILILSGALGNIIDFFLYGHVVDFFAFTFWGYPFPVFNVADSAIFCGMALLVIYWLFFKK